MVESFQWQYPTTGHAVVVDAEMAGLSGFNLVRVMLQYDKRLMKIQYYPRTTAEQFHPDDLLLDFGNESIGWFQLNVDRKIYVPTDPPKPLRRERFKFADKEAVVDFVDVGNVAERPCKVNVAYLDEATGLAWEQVMQEEKTLAMSAKVLYQIPVLDGRIFIDMGNRLWSFVRDSDLALDKPKWPPAETYNFKAVDLGWIAEENSPLRITPVEQKPAPPAKPRPLRAFALDEDDD